MGRVSEFIFKWLSGNPQEFCIPPGSEVCKSFGQMDGDEPNGTYPMFTATTYNNDGAELWICYTKGNWLVHFRKEEALQLSKIILWDWWIKSTWFGLKRKIWYWSLSKTMKNTKA